jgi:acyl carrier protein
MNDQQLAERLADMLRDAFNRPNLEYSAETMMRDILGFDSVQFVQLILALEEAFSVELHEDEVDSIYSMGDIFAMLRGKVPSIS